MDETIKQTKSMLDKVIRFCLENKLVVSLVLLVLIGWGVLVAPFDWKLDFLPRAPVPVDAIPANSLYRMAGQKPSGCG